MPRSALWITSTCAVTHARPEDREGKPVFNPILNTDSIKDEFNASRPGGNVKKNHLATGRTAGRTATHARRPGAAAMNLLPTSFRRPTKLGHYPNGRVPTMMSSGPDDLMVHGTIPRRPFSDGTLRTRSPFLERPRLGDRPSTRIVLIGPRSNESTAGGQGDGE